MRNKYLPRWKKTCWFCGAGEYSEPADNKWGRVTRIQGCPIWCLRALVDYVQHWPRVEWGQISVFRKPV